MSSVVRPSPQQMTRRVVVLAAAAFAIVVPVIQMATGLGLDQGEFAAQGDGTLRVAGYAFSIWGLIYLGILAYAVRQVLPQTGESDAIRRFALPSIVAFVGIGLWIIAAASDARIATLVLIFMSLIALLVPLVVHGGLIRALPKADRDRWLVAWPLGLLAGWLTVAAPLNLITVLTAENALSRTLAPVGWAMLAIVAVVALTLFVTARTRLLAYPLPIAWGLLGAFVAEQTRNPLLGFLALGAALLVLVVSLVLVFRLRPGVERPAV
nr:hypothetical protein [uncultured Brevundimonas sp.]